MYTLVVNKSVPLLGLENEFDVIVDHNEVQFRLDLADYTQRRAYFGAFERKEIRFLERTIKPGSMVVDVGANVGLIAVPLAKIVGSSGRLIAIEPVRSNASALIDNLNRNQISNTEVVEKAVGATNTKIWMSSASASEDVSTGFFHQVEPGTNDAVCVDQVRLDDLICSSSPPVTSIDFLKIDVEGMELEVLEGLGDYLTPAVVRTILFEVIIDRKGVTPEGRKVIHKLSAAGYQIFRISRRGNLREFKTRDFRNKALLSTVSNLLAK